MSSCLAINEVTVFQKILLMALNTRSPDKPIGDSTLQETAFAQAIIIERNLSAKVIEYLNMIGDYKKKCGRKRETKMQFFLERIDDVTAKLRNGENYKLALWYRNTVTNHYLISELEPLIRNGDLGGDDTAHTIYLHEKDGNSSYLLGEQLLLAKLTEDVGSAVDRMEGFSEWVLEASAMAMKLHHEFCIQLLEIYLPQKQAQEYSITPEPHLVGQLKETCLPVLWDFQCLDGFG